MQKLTLYTKEAMPDMAHHMEMLTCAKHAYATTDVQLKRRSEGEKVVVISNSFQEAKGLPEAALWNAGSDKEITSVEQHHLCDFVPSTSIPAGKKSVGSRWVFKNKGRQDVQGQACCPRLGTSRRSRWYVCPCLQDSEHPNGARYGSGVRLGFSTAERPNSVATVSYTHLTLPTICSV